MQKSVHQELLPDPFLIFVNNHKQPLLARISFKDKIFWKSIIKKACKSLFYLSNSVSFNGQDYENQNGPGTSDQLLFRLQSKFRKIPLLVMYYYVTKFDDLV